MTAPSRALTHEQSLLTVEEAADRLRISRWSLYRLIRNRELQTIKIGTRRLIPADALADLIARLQESSDV